MASATPNESADSELHCPVCLDTFVCPCTLSCGHSFCVRCLETAWETVNSFSCPQCRETFPVRPQLRRNVALSNLAEQLRVGDRMATITMCDGKTPAVKTYCARKFQCRLENPGLNNVVLMYCIVNLEDQMCQEHRKEQLNFYCEQDGSLACTVCTIAGDHSGHKVIAVETAQQTKQEIICLEKTKREKNKEKVASWTQQLRGTYARTQESLRGTKERIRREFERRREQLREEEREALERVDEEGRSVLSRIQADIARYENRARDLDQEITELLSAINVQDPLSFLQHPMHEKLRSSVSEETQDDSGPVSCHLDLAKVISVGGIKTNLLAVLYGHAPTLDINSVNNDVQVSSDLRTVTWTNVSQARCGARSYCGARYCEASCCWSRRREEDWSDQVVELVAALVNQWLLSCWGRRRGPAAGAGGGGRRRGPAAGAGGGGRRRGPAAGAGGGGRRRGPAAGAGGGGRRRGPAAGAGGGGRRRGPAAGAGGGGRRRGPAAGAGGGGRRREEDCASSGVEIGLPSLHRNKVPASQTNSSCLIDGMGHQLPFLVVIGFVMLGVRRAEGSETKQCPKDSYKTKDDVCCDLCPAGTFKAEDCLTDGGIRKCIPCIKGKFYTDKPNNESACFDCTPCPEGAEIAQECMREYDSVCQCKEGYYRSNGQCVHNNEVAFHGALIGIVIIVCIVIIISLWRRKTTAASWLYVQSGEFRARTGLFKFITHPHECARIHSDSEPWLMNPLTEHNKIASRIIKMKNG
ncbi:unnamed protein product [Lampetra fluviatilis]